MTEEEKAAKEIEDRAKVRASEMLEKYKDAARLAEELADARNETFKLREDKRVLKANQVPEGATVLSSEDAKKWAAFSELGAPEDVKKQIQLAESAIAERDGLKGEKVTNQAAALLGYKPDVLADLAKSKGFRVEIEGEGEAAKVVARYKDGEADAVKPMSEYAESLLAAYLPSLRATDASPTIVVPVVPFARMSAPGGGKQSNVWDKIRDDKKAKAETANAAPPQSWAEKVGVAQ